MGFFPYEPTPTPVRELTLTARLRSLPQTSGRGAQLLLPRDRHAQSVRLAAMPMLARGRLASGTAVTSVLRSEGALPLRGRAVYMVGRLQGRVGGAHCRGGQPLGRLTRAITMVGLVMPTVAVTHATTASAGGEKCECAHAKREPNPIAAEPIHRIVPSVASTHVFQSARCAPLIHKFGRERRQVTGHEDN